MKDRILFCAFMSAAGFVASALAPVLLGHSWIAVGGAGTGHIGIGCDCDCRGEAVNNETSKSAGLLCEIKGCGIPLGPHTTAQHHMYIQERTILGYCSPEVYYTIKKAVDREAAQSAEVERLSKERDVNLKTGWIWMERAEAAESKLSQKCADYERLREALETCKNALERVSPQARGVLVVQDINRAIEQANDALTPAAPCATTSSEIVAARKSEESSSGGRK